ncbi:c-type cytochrome, methanol metabolism-related [Dongia soli]|uniref:C-type cytochrome, methanol metabolism-related n=1 Tax=Dongia soli TaxID=600628 RepID=A0ABU5EHL0_9PROT|nr:c-type cytochrome, methanol metabolism-related [Dongia soli]MDY0885812.1 c-type cytochrome, methanol metabolism-related [Dongia soli]
MNMRHLPRVNVTFFTALTIISLGCISAGSAQDSKDDANGANPDDKPYHIEADGTTDWPIFNGYRRYHSICHTCHGPDGLGSSFGPNLTESLKHMTKDQFMDVVVNGRTNVSTSSEKRMPALGTDLNVMCYIDDIYAYLKARSDGAIGRGRPQKHASKPQEAAEAEAACMGSGS